jgi:hypothetical protein
MKKLLLPKAEGKTQQLIELSEKTNAYIICKDHVQAYSISSRARAQGRDIPSPLTFDEFIERQYVHRGIQGFLFDDADAFVQHIAGKIPVIAITLTRDAKDVEPATFDFKRKVRKF